MTREQVAEIIRNFIRENFLFDGDVELVDDASLLDEGIIDSTGVLELVQFLDEEFSITIEDDELIPENLDSVSRAAAFVAAKIKPGA